MEEKFTFDDILLVPEYAEVDTREPAFHYAKRLFYHDLKIPVISAAMDTITGEEMLLKIYQLGGLGVHHRYACATELARIANLGCGGLGISPNMFSSSSNPLNTVDFLTELYHSDKDFKSFFAIDVAHGDSEKVYEFCKNLIKNGVKTIISGNVVTKDAVSRYMKIGVNHIKVGVGNGSICSTRTVTGFGYPQGSALREIYEEFKGTDIKIISDGGCNTIGDVVKAFAMGADFVMSGKLFAKCKETPLDKKYRGMASQDALENRKIEFLPEGVSFDVEKTETVKSVMNNIDLAIRAALYYGGCRFLNDLRDVEFIKISNGTLRENDTRNP